MIRHAAALTLLAFPAMAEPEGRRAEIDRFTRANIVATVYHEVAHALIDLLDLPVMGLEEDAADAFAIHMIDRLHREIDARAMILDVAYLHGFEHEERDGAFQHWSRYSTDARRGFNALCFFYGGDPEARAAFALNADLPLERRRTCPDERARQKAAWDAVLDRVPGPGQSLRLQFNSHPIERLLAEIVGRLNDEMTLPRPVDIRVEPCGEPNAYYEPRPAALLICAELVRHISDRRPQ